MGTKKDCRKEEFKRLVALGESTTAGGWTTSRQRCWVSRLAEMINDFQAEPMEFLNQGIGANLISSKSPNYENSGKPAADIRLQKHVIDKEPDLLVISYGLNDARGGTPLELFRREMEKLIDRTREKIDPVIVLPGPYYMSGFSTVQGDSWNHASLELFKEFNNCIRDIADEKDCLFADLLAAYNEADWMVHFDSVHANDLGHRIVANRIFEVIAQNCSCLAKNTKELEKISPRWRDESCLQLECGVEPTTSFN